MQFSEVMSELAEKIGIAPLKFDADGSVALLFDGEHEITFTPHAEDGAVLFSAELAPAPMQSINACLELLKASLLGAKTGGAALAVHEALGTIVLWKRHDDCFTDCTDLEKAINRFLAQVIAWKEHLQSARPAEVETAKEMPPHHHSIKV